MKSHYLFFAAIIFICGLISAAFGIFRYFSSYSLIIFIITLFGLLFLFLKRNLLFITFLSILIFSLGVIRYNAHNLISEYNIKNFIFYSPESIFVQGKVASAPRRSLGGRKESFILKAGAIKSADRWKKTTGLVLVNLYKKDAPSFKYGDIVLLEGALRRPFSYKRDRRFDYGKYLADKRIYSILNVKEKFFVEKLNEDRRIGTLLVRTIYAIRARLESHIESFISPPYSAVLSAILLGKREKLTLSLKDLFAKTGTLHILAISGLHVGIIYFVLRVVLKIFRVERNKSIILSILFLVFFAILAGARASILRAATMFSIFGFGEISKRKIGIFNLTGLSSLMILMAKPNQIFDIGFMLSYAAVLSIVSLSPRFYYIFHRGKKDVASAGLRTKVKHYILGSVSVSLAAWVGLLPLIAYFFGLISPIVVIANLVVIPLLFMIMGIGITLLTLGLLAKFLTVILAESAEFFLFLLIWAVRLFEGLPWSYFDIKSPPLLAVIIYYLVIFIMLWVLQRKKPTFFFLT